MRVAIKEFDGDRDSLFGVLKNSPLAEQEKAIEIMNEVLFRSVEIRFGYIDGVVACVWGLIPPTLLSQAAYMWLITTDIVAENKFLFIRHSQLWIEAALSRYAVLVGDVVIGHASARRWIEWLGGVFGAPIMGRVPFTITSETFNKRQVKWPTHSL